MKQWKLNLESKLYSDIDSQGYSVIKNYNKEQLEYIKQNFDCIVKIQGKDLIITVEE